MGYYLTTEPENAVLAKSFASPKTHTPLSPVKERGYRYYSASLSRWISRDPLSEWSVFRVVIKRPSSLAFQVMLWLSRLPPYLPVYNRPLDHYDPDGLYGNPVSGPDGPIGPSDPYGGSADIPPSIDCSGYASLGGQTCRTCFGLGKREDPYPEKAKKVCEGFRDLYTGEPNQEAAACVAQCLIASEKLCQWLTGCSDRNCCRLAAHVVCYAKCGFVPTKGLPPGGVEVGVGDVAASCASKGLF